MSDENRRIITKFGKATIDNGYYRITSSKEGNYKKHLHILVWEDHYSKPVPEGYDIHHVNGLKTDNRIQNLQCVEHSKHVSFHMKDKKFSEEHKKKLSENHSKIKNTTGYYRVSKQTSKTAKQGFTWIYRYYENGKRNCISNINLDGLEKEVKKRGLEWYKIGDD